MADSNNHNNMPEHEELRDNLLREFDGQEQTRELEITPEEAIRGLEFMKQRVADLTVEIALAEAKVVSLVKYSKSLETKLGIKSEKDLDQVKHPDM